VLVVGGVPLALVATQLAGLRTGLQRPADHLGLEGRLTGEDTSRGVAHIGAVEVEPDAASERFGVVLSEAGVGAGGATLGAVVASLYAFHQRRGVHRGAARVGLEHLLSVGHEASFLWPMFSRYPHPHFS
jgi:hypothetical protein